MNTNSSFMEYGLILTAAEPDDDDPLLAFFTRLPQIVFRRSQIKTITGIRTSGMITIDKKLNQILPIQGDPKNLLGVFS